MMTLRRVTFVTTTKCRCPGVGTTWAMHGKGTSDRCSDAPLTPLAEKPRLSAACDDAKHGRACRSRAGEQANRADRAQSVVVRDRCLTGGRAISFVALADLAHWNSLE
jgi:hypothetical protein